MNENNAAQNVQTSLATDTISVDASRLEEKSRMQKKYRRLSVMLVGVIVIAIAALLLLQFNSRHPKQVEWSEWGEVLPEYVSEKYYIIEEQTLYRSKQLESTTSKEKLSGWTLIGETYDWNEWTGWQESPIQSSNSRQVERKTQYSYRTISNETVYSPWGSWSDWNRLYDDAPKETNLMQVETAKMYEYCRWVCPSCRAYPRDADICPNCGSIENWGASFIFRSTPYSSISFTQKGNYLYGFVEGEMLSIYKGDINKSACSVYRYRERSSSQEKVYSDWSSYEDTTYTASSSREVRTRELYRYRDRSQTPVYEYERWTEWTEYSSVPVTENETTQVETIVQYRFKSKDN